MIQKNSIKVYLGELKLSNSKETQLIIEQAHQAALEGINEAIKSVEKQIQQIIQESETIKNNYDLLISVPGIGHLTAASIICCTNHFIFKLTGKLFALYA